MRIELVHPKELGAADTALWRAHQGADPNLASPYLTPEWAQMVGAVRPDARVCIINGGEGFLGVQRPTRFAAMGLGAPIADRQGVVGVAGLCIDHVALCRALGVGRIDLSHVPSGQPILSAVGGEQGSWIAEVAGGRDLYAAALKQRRSEFVRQTDKKLRKLEREHGHVEFRAISDDAAHFETLLSWKNAQLARSRQPRIWATPWVRAVLDASFGMREGNFSGALFTMTVGDRLVAANYFLRSRRVLHDWVVAHDSAFDAYSPGVQLARWACGWAGENGIAEVEFGPGEYQYKRQLSTGQRALEWGAAVRPSFSSAWRCGQFALRAGIEKLPDQRIAALPGKAMRRLDLMRALAA